MTEEEFYRSTPAKVFALIDRRDELDKRHDFFTAHLVALKFNAHLKKEEMITADDVLAWAYPKDNNVVTTLKPVEFNDVLGADCDFQDMRARMRAKRGQ